MLTVCDGHVSTTIPVLTHRDSAPWPHRAMPFAGARRLPTAACRCETSLEQAKRHGHDDWYAKRWLGAWQHFADSRRDACRGARLAGPIPTAPTPGDAVPTVIRNRRTW